MLTKEDAEKASNQVSELANAMPINRIRQQAGNLNEIFLFIEAVKAILPEKEKNNG